jgi:hypothetical protein
MYWWQRDGVYFVMRHAERGGRIEQVGRLYDLDAAIALAVTVGRWSDSWATANQYSLTVNPTQAPCHPRSSGPKYCASRAIGA